MLGPSIGLGVPSAGLMSHLFTPGDISANLSLWLDASDAATLTATGSSVSQWDDKSPNGAHATQSTASEQPQTGLRTINARNALDFDGALHWLDLPNDTIPYDISLAVCVTIPDSTDNGMIVANQGPTGERFYVRNQRANFGNTEIDLPAFVSGTAILSSAWAAGTGSTTQYISRNGGTATSGAVSRTGINSNQAIGSRNGTAAYFDGAVGELVLVTADGTTDTRQRLEGYLAHKWGLAGDLDPGHPYASAPPTA